MHTKRACAAAAARACAARARSTRAIASAAAFFPAACAALARTMADLDGGWREGRGIGLGTRPFA